MASCKCPHEGCDADADAAAGGIAVVMDRNTHEVFHVPLAYTSCAAGHAYAVPVQVLETTMTDEDLAQLLEEE